MLVSAGLTQAELALEDSSVQGPACTLLTDERRHTQFMRGVAVDTCL